MKIEPNINHTFKIDPINFHIWKLQVFFIFITGCPYECGRPYLNGDTKNVAGLTLMGFKKCGWPYLNGIQKMQSALS